MSTPHPLPDAGVRSSTYYIASACAPCPQCQLSTGLLALALPQPHEVLEADGMDVAGVTEDADKGADCAQGEWQKSDAPAFLFYVERVPEHVRLRLHEVSPHYRPARSEATQSVYWANHCEHCGTLWDDYELHCEPDGAFSPSSDAGAAAVELLTIDAPFEAAASGYTLAPEFFRSMRTR